MHVTSYRHADYHDNQLQSSAIAKCSLTFWRRNYFLIFKHTLYIKCE